jgi:hypothetical protein
MKVIGLIEEKKKEVKPAKVDEPKKETKNKKDEE